MVATELSFVSESYLHAKTVWKGKTARRRARVPEGKGATSPFGVGRDPRGLGEVLIRISEEMGWSGEIDRARLLSEWSEFVGETTAEHTKVIGVTNGVLQIQCDSTTWATELRRLRAEMLTRVLRDYPESEIRDLRFLGPGAPSWRHGPRTVQGRGPRDTYG